MIVLILSIYVLGTLLFSTFFPISIELSRLLNYIDNSICLFFIFEFFYRLYHANNKLDYLKWEWVDLISSIPTLDILRPGRALRLIRLLRILRAFRSTRHIAKHIFRNKAQGAFTSVALIALLMVIFSAIAILQLEDDPNSNIKTAEDAIWWSYVTITTVGYGDKFPITTEGRIIAAALMTVGVGLFGTFTGFVASWFVKSNNSSTSTGDN
ncbi:MAG: potassium channel family protein [Bacteroidetes bacterium]|nr:potassium channel family protein [Bacteroidota bacterium]